MKKILTLIGIVLFSTSALGKLVDYKIKGRAYQGYMINKGSKAPLVLIVHDWDGLTDYEEKRSEMLAKLGYSVFAMDLYGKGVRPVETSEKKKITASFYKDRKKMREHLYGGLSEAKRQGLNVKNAVVIGYCFGGTAILELARSGANLKGFASFHGGLGIPKGQDYKNTKGKIIVFHGSADESVSLDDFAMLTKVLEKSHIPHEMTTYSGAPHAFSVFGSSRYRKEADQKSWARFLGFLKEEL